METKELKELIQMLSQTDYKYIEVEHEGSRLILSKEKRGQESVIECSSKSEVMERSIENLSEEILIEKKSPEKELDCFIIKSPMVGTFYEAPAPDEPSFVKVGDKIKVGDTLCIIEAMKLMNTIDSEIQGEILEVLIENESIVEFGQPMFKVKLRG